MRGLVVLALGLSGVACASTGRTRSDVQDPFTDDALRHRVETFSHDSLMGRRAGTRSHDQAVHYIAGELSRLGLEPAGDSGTYFQVVPLVRRVADPGNFLVAGDIALVVYEDFVILDFTRPLTSPEFDTEIVFAGFLDDSVSWIAPEAARGKFLVFAHRPPGSLNARMVMPGGRYTAAAGVALTNADDFGRVWATNTRDPNVRRPTADDLESAPPVIILQTAALARVFKASVFDLVPGQVGGRLRGRLAMLEAPAPTRNVVAIAQGRDAQLASQFVALGAHSDHIGMSVTAFDHDSLRAFNTVFRPTGANDDALEETPARRARFEELLAAARASRQARRDSIFNGADDNATGAMAILAVAEAIARSPTRRSILFVWHTAEEAGLIGAEWFTDHPTVPLDSIVAHINVDMLGRGSGDTLDVLGPRRRSADLLSVVEGTNAAQAVPFALDYTRDEPEHPDNSFCRSDHAMYHRFGIPVVYLSTGAHQDYHMVTDEARYIDYATLGRAARLVLALTRAIGDRAEAIVRDGPAPEVGARCVQ